MITGYKVSYRPLTRIQILSSKALAAVRAPVEGMHRRKAGAALVRALLVLTHREVSR